MGSPSRERVTETLERLQERYSAFDVQQTSVGVPTEVYERADEGGLLDAAVRIRNDTGELLVTELGEGEPTPLRVRCDPDPDGDPVAEVEAAVRARTGVGCRIEALVEVAIVTVHDEADADRDPVYLLDASFEGRYEGGTPSDRLAWRDELEEPNVAY